MRKTAILVLALALPALGHAQAERLPGFSFSLAPVLGLLYGQSEEIVYLNSTSGDKLSELIWELKPLVYLGVQGGLDWQGGGSAGFFSTAVVKFGIPGTTGVTEDRDWMDARYPDFLTHYSVHACGTESAVLVDAVLGLSLRLSGAARLRFALAYNLMSFSWTARGGSDASADAATGHGYLRDQSMEVGTYRQTWNIRVVRKLQFPNDFR